MAQEPGRQNARLGRPLAWDSAAGGAFFITLVTREREPLLGRVTGGKVILSECGRVVAEEWRHIEASSRRLRLDEFVLMPNHLHGILWLGGKSAANPARRPRKAKRRPSPPAAGTLGALITQFKAATSKRVNAGRGGRGSLWEPGYRHILIHNEQELDAMRRHVRENPSRWAEDVENVGLRRET